MKKIITISVAFTILILSCRKKKDEVVIVPPVLKTYLVKKSLANIGDYTYNYDAQNRMTSEVFASSNEVNNKSYTNTINTYDAQGHIATMTTDYVSSAETDLKINVTYNANGKPDTWAIINLATGATLYTYKLEYTTTSFKTTTLTTTGVQLNASLYTLSADGKRINQLQSYNSSNVITSTQVYSGYDDKKNEEELYPLGFRIVPAYENNSASVAVTNAAGTVTNISYTYEYNADGYRTKRTNSLGSINTYEYTKK
jgi:YD repeat-containing protein